MLSATLKAGLGHYDIGGKLRTLRLKKKMGLVERGQDGALARNALDLKGTLSVQVGTDERALGQGDSIYFDSSIPHSYGRGGERACSAIVVTSV